MSDQPTTPVPTTPVPNDEELDHPNGKHQVNMLALQIATQYSGSLDELIENADKISNFVLNGTKPKKSSPVV